MIYKLFIEEGKYLDIKTGEPRNMVCGEIAYTPEGINIGWDEFDSDEDAMVSYGIELKPILEEPFDPLEIHNINLNKLDKNLFNYK
jgi:hypothetical protein